MRSTQPIGGYGSSHQTVSDRFGRFGSKIAQLSGRSVTFLFAGMTVVGWALLGPIFHYSDTWQLVINTGTTIITFLMVFLIKTPRTAIHLPSSSSSTSLSWRLRTPGTRLPPSKMRQTSNSTRLRKKFGGDLIPTAYSRDRPPRISRQRRAASLFACDEGPASLPCPSWPLPMNLPLCRYAAMLLWHCSPRRISSRG